MRTRFLTIIVIGMVGFVGIPYSYASCAAPLFGDPGPCFDSFSVRVDDNNVPIFMTEQTIMENFARNIEITYDDWQISDRNWTNVDLELELPAIICTEFVANGMKHYRMAKWVDEIKISSWEDHYNPSLCDKWLAPIDDGIKLKWDKDLYPSNDIASIQVIDKDMNLDSTLLDSFDIHVWSDTDHTGIQLTVIETSPDAGYFYGNVIFTTTDESSGTRLLVEDAVYANHKGNRDFSRIINEIEPPGMSKSEQRMLNLVLESCECHASGEGCFAFGSEWQNSTHFINNNICKFIPLNEIGYEESENIKLASDRLNESDQTFGDSSPSIFDEYSIDIPIIIIGIVFGMGSFFGLMIFWRKRK